MARNTPGKHEIKKANATPPLQRLNRGEPPKVSGRLSKEMASVPPRTAGNPADLKEKNLPAIDKKKPRVWKIALIVLVLLLVLLAISAVLFVNGKLNKLNYQEDSEIVAPEDIYRDEDSELDAAMKDLEKRESGAELPSDDVFRNKDVINILILGTDIPIPNTKDRGRCDATLICSLNKKTGEIKLISFERAIGVPIPNDEDTKLNAAFRHGGGPLMQSIISDCFLVDLTGYVHISYESFPKVIDAIGGIDMELSMAEAGLMNEYLNYNPSLPRLQEGMNHLNGTAAYSYARMREYDSDWKRQNRVRNVVQASVDQVKSLSLLELNTLADTILPLVSTNLTKTQISSLILNAPKFVNADITQLMIPGGKEETWSYMNNYNEIMMGCDYTECARQIREFLYG